MDAQLSQRELSGYLAALDIVINPSNSPQETFCMVNIEAMALGIPIVSFGMYGQGEYFSYPGAENAVNASNQALSSPNVLVPTELSARSLADATLQYLDNATLRGIVSRNARFVAQRFSPGRSASQFLAAMRGIHHAANA